MAPTKKEKIYTLFKKINNEISEGYKLNIAQTKKKISMSMFKNLKIEQQIDYKPHGVWISGLFKNNENSWSDWVYDNDFIDWLDPKKCTYYAIKIINDPKLVLKINTIKKIEKFHKKYGIKNNNSVKINWKNVQDDGYYGVNFSKYFKSLKQKIEYSWYNSLDTTCVCIWDGRAFEDIKKIDINNL